MSDLTNALARNRDQWTRLGATDPLWAILTHEDKRGNQWDEKDFFGWGRFHAEVALKEIRALRPDFAIGDGLDFGCGVGRLTQAFAPNARSMTGVDVSAPMIEKAETFNRFPEKCRYRINARPDLGMFEDGAFDFVFSLVVLQHIPVELSRSFVREFVRLLAPGGIGYFNLPDLAAPRLSTDGDPWGFDMYGLPTTEVHDLLQAGGATILETTTDGWCGPDIPSYRYIFTR